jgi:hypothetical protein
MNRFSVKSIQFGTFRIGVKNNARLWREVKKHAFLMALLFRAESQSPRRNRAKSVNASKQRITSAQVKKESRKDQ